ncbi:hypothetical protein GFC29_287 [Anoxybacillus sp. B7M1]|jgi:uncharacterized protein|uniref:DUF177 domain-containing protein n=1 Tax=Anoxybacteroides rupiense TaxID=311460 RepID=A0ABD5IQ55_9BACL|nr:MULTISPECIES: DUF177 domain-containing protein [Anoxybacillus]ANB58809.1 hypothetical protein GFC28_1340 [Anoxybacillus sp. B2M1]ANB64457.1 hypothetical protein GFC29_287 [Anoxybacillus sp. B7M1]KXG10443.1 hypothetical protein AT864_01034 [Anoxybacillus sp. P3H1B]MBB3906273.1 uncharacterized protein [Anoxybacillus rupiensis]MBS2770743.1 DUF177 domain-containing protein [Anoxybacillus rupiensis]
MKWSIHQLHQLQAKGLVMDEMVDVSDLKQMEPSIRDISPVRVKGRADIGATKFTFHLTIEGTMVLPCSRTLVDVSYPFAIHTTETFFLNDYDVHPDEETHLVQGDAVDLLPIVKELILLEIPMQIFSEQENIQDGAPQSGAGWEVITEEQAKNKIDPRLAGLAKFFDKKEE